MRTKNSIKKIFFALGMFLLAICLIEAAAWIGLTIINRQVVNRSDIENKKLQISQLLEQDSEKSEHDEEKPLETLHPFLGFTYNKDRNDKDLTNWHKTSINDFGFLESEPLRFQHNDDEFVVGIFGGSVASWTATGGQDLMISQLEKLPELAGRKPIILSTALGGYKQPQQLMALTYLLSLGAKFDVVVNLDGFNEVALPIAENFDGNVFWAFPRNWAQLAKSNIYFRQNSALQELIAMRTVRKSIATKMNNFSCNSSYLCGVVWQMIDLLTMRKINKLETESINSRFTEFGLKGPDMQIFDNPSAIDFSVKVWKQSSLQMNNICKSNGIRYFHFLQPNQYDANSKQLTKEEMRDAYQENHPYSRGVRMGYDKLRQAGQELKNEGVAFTDLTKLFATNHETVYSDSCCHFNSKGTIALSAEIIQAIRKDLQK